MIKDDYTHHECLGLSRFILLVVQLLRGWSKDLERQRPARLPTIPSDPKSNMRKAMEKLRDLSCWLVITYG
uniref:Uncharacterized protein n=1 Tax=Ditylenchus dipsaci TaxID=166011 RepID=A0A915CUJ6_9BILA